MKEEQHIKTSSGFINRAEAVLSILFFSFTTYLLSNLTFSAKKLLSKWQNHSFRTSLLRVIVQIHNITETNL